MGGDSEKYYELRYAAQMLGIKVRTIRAWIAEGKIQATKTSSNRWLVAESEIKRWLDLKTSV